MTSFRINDVTLRDEPDDPLAARRHLQTLESGPDRLTWLRMLGELQAAEELGWRLLTESGGPGSLDAAEAVRALPIDALAPALRLAHVLHWQARFRDADILFDLAIVSARAITAAESADLPDRRRAARMTAFAWQHLGKSRFDEQRFEDALRRFQRALALRLQIEAPDDEVASSRQAIAATRARLERQSPDDPSAEETERRTADGT